MQLIGSLIQRVSAVGIGGRASLAEILVVMGGTTAAVLLIVWLMKCKDAFAEVSRPKT